MKHTIEDLIKFAKENNYPKDRVDELRKVTNRTVGASNIYIYILNANISIVEKIDLLSGTKIQERNYV